MIHGKSMVQRVYEQALKSSLFNEVIIATDHAKIFEHVRNFGANVQMTSPHHQSGTERCAEVASSYEDNDIIINIQGDEPFILPEQIDCLINLLIKHATWPIGTLVKKIEQEPSLHSPHIVKAVFSKKMEALYFSRQVIPFVRDVDSDEWMQKCSFYQHLGMYAYRKKALLEIASLPASDLESAEKLEQLRWLDNGYTIGIGITERASIGIDTQKDLENARVYAIEFDQKMLK